MDIGDFLRRDTFGNQHSADFVIDVEAIGIGCRKVAEDKLRQSPFFSCRPCSVNVLDCAGNFRVSRLGEWIDQAHIERCLPAVPGDLEHVVDGRIDLHGAELLRTGHERFDISL